MKTPATKDLVAGVLGGNPRLLARALSVVENRTPVGQEVLKEVFPKSGGARIIGVTGPPGAGKSTLTDCLVGELLAKGHRVAVVAIDPSSPFGGGAVLGDRVRMTRIGAHENVFIRSMASRGALGGLSPSIFETLTVLDAAGYEFIFVETVGVGQAEVEIVRLADVVLVVLVPGMGDTVQALKAGILEIADLFAINKSDHEGAERLKKELLGVVSLAPDGARKPEIYQTVATENKGVSQLIEGALKLIGSSGNEARRREFLRRALEQEVAKQLISWFHDTLGEEFEGAVARLLSRSSEPVGEAERLVRDLLA